MPNISKEFLQQLSDHHEGDEYYPLLQGPLDQPEGEPAFWMQSTHLSHFLNKHAGSESFLARCSSRQLHDDYKPCYTHPAPIAQQEGEPVAYMFKTNEGTEIGGLAPLPTKRELLEISMQSAEVIPLYTHPAPFTPITSIQVPQAVIDDLWATGEVASKISGAVKIARIVNAYMRTTK